MSEEQMTFDTDTGKPKRKKGSIEDVEINELMKRSYIDYSMSVIVGRALPDVRDGLKPVHRRILYDMGELGVTPDRPHRKSARIVGDVLGKYHPHGDSSVYDAMVRLAQPWNIRCPLVDGHGNFGSVDGDGAAAMRYTEVRLTPLATEMLRDLKKDTVDFQPNFDGDEEEPAVLPARFPNLLVNGASGIAVGMATSIPPHNLREVVDGAVAMIDNPDCTVEDLLKIIKAPDFPTGGEIIGKEEIKDAYRTGQGKITVRSRFKLEEPKKGRISLVFTEIPYQVNKAKLIEKIAALVKERKIEGISDVRDESGREGMRIVVDLKKDASPQMILDRLFKSTPLQEKFSITMLALDQGVPKILNLYEILDRYLTHRKEVVRRRTCYDLKKAEERLHIVEGYLIALDHIDEVIRTIRSAYDDAKEKLMERFLLSDLQARAILDMRLARLQGMEREKLENEKAELLKNIEWYHRILSEEQTLMGVIRAELLEIREKYGDKRRTAIRSENVAAKAIEKVKEDDAVYSITYSQGEIVRRINPEADTSSDRDLIARYDLSSRDAVIFMTSHGRALKINACDLPLMRKNAKGLNLASEYSFATKETVIFAGALTEELEKNSQFLLFTANGMVKKTELSQYRFEKPEGPALRLREKDTLVKALVLNRAEQDVLLVTKQGRCIRFLADDISATGRNGLGVTAIKLGEGDLAADAVCVRGRDTVEILLERGSVKKAKVEDFQIQTRGGKGVMLAPKVGLKRSFRVKKLGSDSSQ